MRIIFLVEVADGEGGKRRGTQEVQLLAHIFLIPLLE